LTLGLSQLKHSALSDDERKKIEQLSSIANHLCQEVSRLAFSLRPKALEDLGLRSALLTFADNWARTNGKEVEFHTTGLESTRLSSVLETTIYRIVQESMTNVLKHSKATNVSIILQCKKHYV